MPILTRLSLITLTDSDVTTQLLQNNSLCCIFFLGFGIKISLGCFYKKKKFYQMPVFSDISAK